MPPRAVAVACLGLVVGAGACLVSIDESRIGAAGAGGSAGASGVGGGAGGAAPGCPSAMIAIPGRDPGQPTYCLDATEVTVAAYAAFFASPPDVASLPAACAWKTAFDPPPEGAADDLPVTEIDWCDAFAYCASVGKRLCGKVGGGSNAFEDGVDASKSEWFNACTKNGARAFPYGADYEPAACAGADYDGDPGYQANSDTPVAVGSAKACEGGFSGVFDMSGNASEWEDSCDAAGDGCDAQPDGGPACDWCRARGGSYGRPPGGSLAGLSCADGDNERRSARYSDLGIRCCADAVR